MATFKYGLIGKNLSHSFSAEIHPLLADYDYQLKEIEKEDLSDFLENVDFKGINVTIPYKEEVVSYLDQIDPLAQNIGAVNTIIKDKGQLIGYNTDILGLEALIKSKNVSLKNKKILILGTGATSKTAYQVATNMAAKNILTLSRHGLLNQSSISYIKNRLIMTYDEALKTEKDSQIIINTTPCGMFPDLIGHTPIPLTSFSKLSGVFDCVYNPLCSQLVLDAKKKNVPAAGGLYMLIMQAFYAARLFTGELISENLARKAFRKILSEKQNIVLIGMPSSGKSSIGKALSDITGREFLDTDQLIVEQEGKSIKQIFAKKGEQYFREIESQVIQGLLTRTQCIIATGGGSILNQKNIDALKANGKIYFLDRPLENLIPTVSRPLTSTLADLNEKYRERYPLYLDAADKKIAARGAPDKIAQQILKEHESTLIGKHFV